MNAFVKWLASPLSEWHVSSLSHKALAGAAGAAMAWYLYKYKQLPTWQIVLYALATAYGASMVLNAISRFNGAQLQQATVAPALPEVSTFVETPIADQSFQNGGADTLAAPILGAEYDGQVLAEDLGEGGDDGIFA